MTVGAVRFAVRDVVVGLLVAIMVSAVAAATDHSQPMIINRKVVNHTYEPGYCEVFSGGEGQADGWPTAYITNAEYRTCWHSPSHSAWIQLEMTIKGNGSDPFIGGPGGCDSLTMLWIQCLTGDANRCPGGDLSVADYSVTVVDMDPAVAENLYEVHLPPDSQRLRIYFKDDLQVTLSVTINWGYVPQDDLGRSAEFFIRSEAVNAWSFPVEVTGGTVKLDDQSEENDSMSSPRQLVRGANTYPARVLMGEEDWYFQPKGTDTSFVFTIFFEHDYGNLDLCVYNGDSNALVGCSATSSSGAPGNDKEVVSVSGTNVVNGWLIKVYGVPGALTNSYDLQVSAPSGGGGGGCKCYFI